jgi:hypothetical protein
LSGVTVIGITSFSAFDALAGFQRSVRLQRVHANVAILGVRHIDEGRRKAWGDDNRACKQRGQNCCEDRHSHVSFSCFGSLATFFESAAYNEHPAAGEGCLLQG